MNSDQTVLVIATGNPHKVLEIESILRGRLADLPFAIVSGLKYAAAGEPEESGATFVENALIKARHYARASGELALADDSGLVVDALDGRPGLVSARYAPTARGRIERVLAELNGVEPVRRTARFVCAMALADPAGNSLTGEGRVEGRITDAPRGDGGFGYDPIFVPGSEPRLGGRTLAEFEDEEKNRISHRSRAIEAVAAGLRRSLRAGRVAPRA